MATYQKGTPEWKIKNFAKCWEDLELETRANNPFLKAAAEIKAICYRDGCDVGVGLDKYIAEHYTNEEREDIDTDHIADFKMLCGRYYLDYIVAVQAFMEGTK